MPAAVSSAIEERRKYGVDMSKTRTGNLSIWNEKEHKNGTKEYAAEAEHDKENDQKLQGLSETRKVRFSKAAMERTSTKLSMVGIDQCR